MPYIQSGHHDNGYFVTVTEAKEFVTPLQGHNKIVLATSLSLLTVKNSAALVTFINGTKFIRYKRSLQITINIPTLRIFSPAAAFFTKVAGKA